MKAFRKDALPAAAREIPAHQRDYDRPAERLAWVIAARS